MGRCALKSTSATHYSNIETGMIREMKASNKPETQKSETLFEALAESVSELQRGIDRHRCLVRFLLREELDVFDLPPVVPFPKQSREQRLEKAIKEAIDELEKSRSSFKSKRLEILRKKLTQTLLEGRD
jgi:hypothetical protein